MNKQTILHSPKVIIADDSPEIRMILTCSLEQCDCEVIATAENGQIAIELLESSQADIIFLDIEMPIKTGFDVLDAIKEKNISVCSIMLSGHSSKENLVSAIKKGAKGFLVKPHSQKKLEDVIANYLISRSN